MATTAKIDMLREARELYVAHREPGLVEVPEFTFLMIDGHGDPNLGAGNAIQALYQASYRIKFRLKKSSGVDYKVMPLEGVWWASDMGAFTVGRKGEWNWTLMIRQPDEVDEELVESLPSSQPLRLERWEEGRAAQLMHVGPYSAEGPAIERLHAYIADQGLQMTGKHHEIYLGDPRRSAPERLRTVVRQPVA